MAEKERISKSEVIKIIKEEYDKKKKEITLKKRLQEVESKIDELLNECDTQNLEEVEADGETTVPSTAWTGEKNSDVKFKPKFNIKGSHKLEEDEDLDSEPVEDEISEDDESIEEILQKLADAIENKVEDVVDEKIENSEEKAEEEAEEKAEEEAEEEVGTVEEIGGGDGTGPHGAGNGPGKGMHDGSGLKEPIEENAEEPQEGHSPATEESKDAPSKKTPYTQGQDTIKEGKEEKKPLISEATKKRYQLLSGIKQIEK